MKTIQFVAIFFISILLFSCGNNSENRSVKEHMSAFLNDNPTIAVFGKVDLNSLLNKADYKSVPKFGNLIESELNELQKTICP